MALKVSTEQLKLFADSFISDRTHFYQSFYNQSEQKAVYNKVFGKKLGDYYIAQHLKDKITIGVIPLNLRLQSAKLMCFDFDFYVSLNEPSFVVKLISPLHEAGLNDHQIHVEFSGKKGWHLWIFFQEFIPLREVLPWANLIVQFSKLPELEKFVPGIFKIELRPESESGRCVKLPLGIHQETRKKSIFVNRKFNRITDQWKYLEKAQTNKVSKKLFNSFCLLINRLFQRQTW